MIAREKIPQTLSDPNISPEILEKIAKQNPKALVAAIQHSYHSSPIPPAAELEKYELTCPGLAHRIVAMAEKEQEYAHEENNKILSLELQKTENEYSSVIRGQNYCLLYAVITLVVAVWLGSEGHDWLAGGIISAVAGVLTYIAYRYKHNAAAPLKK